MYREPNHDMYLICAIVTMAVALFFSASLVLIEMTKDTRPPEMLYFDEIILVKTHK